MALAAGVEEGEEDVVTTANDAFDLVCSCCTDACFANAVPPIKYFLENPIEGMFIDSATGSILGKVLVLLA